MVGLSMIGEMFMMVTGWLVIDQVVVYSLMPMIMFIMVTGCMVIDQVMVGLCLQVVMFFDGSFVDDIMVSGDMFVAAEHSHFSADFTVEADVLGVFVCTLCV